MVLLVGDNIDTDNIAPGGYLHLAIEEQIKHCLESVITNFSSLVKPGDIIIAGENFGTGSSREQAPILLKTLGISAVIAKSFSRLFYRNSINVGLYPGVYKGSCPFSSMEDVETDLKNHLIRSEGNVLYFDPPRDILMDILKAGGMKDYARKLLGRDTK